MFLLRYNPVQTLFNKRGSVSISLKKKNSLFCYVSKPQNKCLNFFMLKSLFQTIQMSKYFKSVTVWVSVHMQGIVRLCGRTIFVPLHKRVCSYVCVCVCVWLSAREREIERESYFKLNNPSICSKFGYFKCALLRSKGQIFGREIFSSVLKNEQNYWGRKFFEV